MNDAGIAATPKSLTALSIAEVARLLSAAYRRQVTEDQVRAIAEAGDLLHGDGTLSLIDYVAFLAEEATRGGTD